MRTFSEPVFSAATNATATSSAVDFSSVMAFSVVVTFTDGAAAGTLKVQVANTLAPVTGDWVDLSGATVTAASGATSIIPKTDASYQWARLVWTRTGGAGTLTAQLKTLGF